MVSVQKNGRRRTKDHTTDKVVKNERLGYKTQASAMNSSTFEIMKGLLIVAVLVTIANAQNSAMCNACDYIVGMAYKHFNNHVTDQAALLQELAYDCNAMRNQGQGAFYWCENFVHTEIGRIFGDLSNGKDVWQTCVDTTVCKGPEPSVRPMVRANRK